MGSSANEGTRLGDFVSLVRGTTYKSARLGEPGPALLGLASIARDGGFRHDSLKTYGGESGKRLLLHPGDLYVSLKDVTQSGDLLGAVARVPGQVGLGRLTQDTVRLDFEGDPNWRRYVYWSLRAPEYRTYCRARAIGTTNLSLSREDFLDFKLPPLSPERQGLVDLLEGLDDKIELNRRMSRTLDEMAQALFRSWFVDFQRTQGILVQSELGVIPVGWSVGCVGDIADIIDCLHSKKPERQASGRLFLQLNNIKDDGLLDVSDTYLINDADYRTWISRMEARQGDCVITNVGRSGAVAQIPWGLSAALGRNMTGIRLHASFQYPTFLIELLRSPAMKAEVSLKLDSGTILDALNVRSIPRLRFVMPPAGLLTEFEQTARPIRCRMESLLEQSRSLVAVRDALLPRLLSGMLKANGVRTTGTRCGGGDDGRTARSRPSSASRESEVAS